MSDKRRKKNDRRQRRLDKRQRQQASREARLQPVTCPNCYERYGSVDDPAVIHRAGPCDCTPAIRQAMNDFLDARRDAYNDAPDGKIACPTCGTMHGDGEQSTIFFECRMVWNGCDYCLEAQAARFAKIREDHRERWFGVRHDPPTPKGISTVPTVGGKYAPPAFDSFAIKDSVSVYAGSFVDPSKKPQ